MTLHLAASFSRDAPLLGLCFAFTALLLDAAFGPEKQKALSPARLALLLGCGVLLAPGKLVYLPLAALLLVVPAARLGHHAKAKKCGYLAVCLALALLLNTGLLTDTLHSGAVQEPAAAAAEPACSDRAAKGTPTPADWEYEAQINENSLENYVKRLYYYVEDNAVPAKSEVDFWVQALREKDVTPAVLGQSFLFAADKANTYTDAQAFYTEASLVLFGTDVTVGNADAYLPYFTEGGAVQAYKQLFSLPSCQEQFAGLEREYPGLRLIENPYYSTCNNIWQKRSRPPARPAVPRARRMRPTRLPIRPGTSCGIPWPLSCCLCAAPWKTATTISARWWAAV